MKASVPHSAEKHRSQKRDNDLVQESLAGKSTAFAKLVAQYQARVAAVGYSFFHNQADTEDFVQEVFIKAYQNLATFRWESSFSTWLTRIAYTTAINTKNRSKTYESLADDAILVAPTKGPEEDHIRSITASAVKEAVQELPPQYAVCLDFYFFYDFSYDEIAVITGFPVNTIKSYIFRAKKILRKKLQDFY